MRRNKRMNRNSIPVSLLPNAQFELKEAYRSLRTNLQFLSVDSKLKSILVTSTQPMEGKTTVSVNLAMTLAIAGYKVLLVDMDLRNPRVHKYLEQKAIPGVTNYLIGDADINEIIISTEYGFDMIASGPLPPNPAEMIGSEKVRALIEYAEGKYDYVLYDTPPVGLVTDAAVLSKNVDGVLFVARYATTNVEAAKAAKESLDNVDARIIGCVITDVEKDGYRKKKYYSYKGYNYGYGGYGEYGGYNREE